MMSDEETLLREVLLENSDAVMEVAAQLAEVVAALDLPDASLSSLLGGVLREKAAIRAAERHTAAAEEARERAERDAAAARAVEERTGVAERALKAAEPAQKEQAEATAAQISVVRANVAELTKEEPSMESPPPITHGDVLAAARELERLEREATEAEEALASYADLPADITMAQLAVAAARKELSALDRELSTKVEEMME